MSSNLFVYHLANRHVLSARFKVLTEVLLKIVVF